MSRPGTAPDLLPRPRHAAFDGQVAGPGDVRELPDPSLPAQGYRIRIATEHVEVSYADEPGRFYARCTLDQLRRDCAARAPRAAPGSLPHGEIVDWPDIAVRGVMLDVSRDRIPTAAALLALVDRLAKLKCNHLQLYMEHTFAYAGHEDVWRDASPFSAEEIEELQRHCASRHIELAANQNCFGHMERWLRHRAYRPLALAPVGFRDPFGLWRPPTTLDATVPGSKDLVADLLGELVPLFASPRVHVGMDEPWELPRERYGDWSTWVSWLRGQAVLDGREMLIWGDVLTTDPSLAGSIPEGVTVCEWGYDAGHPFDDRLGALVGAGVPAWACPGTSAWMSVLGRASNMVANCAEAARSALSHGLEGVLVTEWGDLGYFQPLAVTELGLAYGLAAAWCTETNGSLDLTEIAAATSLHVFEDPTGELGRAVAELGDAHRATPMQIPNLSSLVTNVFFPQLPSGAALTMGMGPEHVEAAAAEIEAAMDRLERALPSRPDGGPLVDELRWAGELALLACTDHRNRLAGDGTLAGVGEAERRALALSVDALAERHREQWMRRSRPGGLAESLAWLEHLAAAQRTGVAPVEWSGPLAVGFGGSPVA